MLYEKALCFLSLLVSFLIISVQASETSSCYIVNTNKGNELHDSHEYIESIRYYKNAYSCAAKRSEKIASLASLSAAELSSGNKTSSSYYLLELLKISPNNKWAIEFSKNNGLNSFSSEIASNTLEKNKIDNAIENYRLYIDGVRSLESFSRDEINYILLIVKHFESKKTKSKKQSVFFEKSKERSLLGLPQTIFISGEITSETVKELVGVISSNNIKTATVNLDSPGGDLLAGIEIGKIIRKNSFHTSVDNNEKNVEDSNAICYSACVLIYAGGVSRSLQSGAKIGVHRFSRNFSSEEDLDLAQVISARVIKYLVEMGVDVKLFERMSKTAKDDIDVIELQDALRLKLVNNGEYEQGWTLENVKGEGVLYLRGINETWRGVGKLLFTCDSKNVIYATAIYSRGSVIPSGKYGLVIDNKNYMVAGDMIENKSDYMVVFKPSIDHYKMISKASKVGFSIFAMNPDLYYNFSLDIDQKGSLVSDYMRRCIRLQEAN